MDAVTKPQEKQPLERSVNITDGRKQVKGSLPRAVLCGFVVLCSRVVVFFVFFSVLSRIVTTVNHFIFA